MSHSDIILMVMGVALIIAGSVLFITGKQAGGKNKIEALGIKMDVSNPSLVLIIFGILLLLSPRMMPDNGSTNTLTTKIATGSYQAIETDSDKPSTPAVTPSPVATASKPKPRTQPALQGNYELVTYIEDGETITADGQLSISPAKDNIYPFTGSVQAYIDWSTTINFQYEGYIAHRGDKWFLKINAASDPEWVDRGEVSMKLVRDKNSISMKYYYDANIYVLWQR